MQYYYFLVIGMVMDEKKSAFHFCILVMKDRNRLA